MSVKYKFTGQSGLVDFTLISENFMNIDEKLEKNKIYEFDFSKNPKIQRRLDANGYWVRIEERQTSTNKKGDSK